MSFTILVIAIIIALFVFILCGVFSRPSSKFYMPDTPTNRSLHSVKISRAGGVAIILPILISWIIVILFIETNINFEAVLAGLFILILISYLDDRRELAPLWRLLVHICTAFILVGAGLKISSSGFDMGNLIISNYIINIALILLIVWSINLYNFMDGIDGLAGGMGFIGFLCLTWHGWMHESYLYMYLTIVVAAANCGFLLHNFPPAKIFMGDTGSIAMGYTATFFSIWGFNDGLFAWWVPILIFSPFLVDSTATLLKRLLKGDKIWQAHRSHYYQKLVLSGWSHRKVVISEYILMLIAAGTAIYSSYVSYVGVGIYVLITWFIIYVALIASISVFTVEKDNAI